MSAARRVATVDAWPSPHCTTRYSVSECDSDGDEIRCSDGARTAAAAFEIARDLAESLGVPARLLDSGNRVVEEWEP